MFTKALSAGAFGTYDIRQKKVWSFDPTSNRIEKKSEWVFWPWTTVTTETKEDRCDPDLHGVGQATGYDPLGRVQAAPQRNRKWDGQEDTGWETLKNLIGRHPYKQPEMDCELTRRRVGPSSQSDPVLQDRKLHTFVSCISYMSMFQNTYVYTYIHIEPTSSK